MDADALIQAELGQYAPNTGPGTVPPSLPMAIVRKVMFEGPFLFLGELSSEDEMKWQTAYQDFLAGA